jgi:hypothetical protein
MLEMARHNKLTQTEAMRSGVVACLHGSEVMVSRQRDLVVPAGFFS